MSGSSEVSAPGFWPPGWPMGLTMLRLLLLPVFLWVLLVEAGPAGNPHRWAAVAIFAIMAATDKLDGYLARKLNQTSKLGAILDPMADKILVGCSIILLSTEWVAPRYNIPLWVVAAVYGKDLIVAAGTLAVISLVGHVNISARPLGKLSTALQLALIMATLLAPDLARLGESVPRILLSVLWWGVAVVAVVSCLDYVRLGIRLKKQHKKDPDVIRADS